MPYPNEYSVRIHNPGMYENFARKNIVEGIDVILGIREGKSEVQAYRFNKEKYSLEDVKEWLKKNNIKYLKIESASENDDLRFYGTTKDKLPILNERVKSDRGEILENYHLDYVEFNDKNLIKPFSLTSEGYLVGRAVVTNIGVFEYADGNEIRRELRLPEEVFNPNSLKTLELKPVTNGHPTEIGGLITADNIKENIVGYAGNFRIDNRFFDYNERDFLEYFGGYFVTIDLCIFDKDTIEAIKNGKRALSCGYVCNLEPAINGARYLGMPYDFIQRDIRYNHIAVVDMARAGEHSKIELKWDGLEIENKDRKRIWVFSDFVKKFDCLGGKEMNLKTIILDGVEYQAEAEVIKELKTLQEKLDILTKEKEDLKKSFDSLKEKLEGERDALKDELEKKTKELETFKNDELKEKVKQEVKEKVRLLEVAKEVNIDGVEDLENLEIKKVILKAKNPDLTLDGKSEDYINARFDILCELLQKEKEEKNKEVVKVDKAEEIYTSEVARKKMIDELKNQSRIK